MDDQLDRSDDVRRELAEVFGGAPEKMGQVGDPVVDGIIRDVTNVDPTERALALTARMHSSQQFVEWMSRYRDQAVKQMREHGASYDQVARALRLSKSRAQQLVKRLEG